ncbi:hypothetical protein ABWK22_01640 [Gottfriedia acidiceleris]|uniref:hypothetical protein n=1 Tax=Gottfriedia acidiceleris TaxID=371036 RepID=UPI003395599B
MSNGAIAQAFLYTFNQLATKKLSAVDANREVLISNNKVLDIGKEIIIPKQLIQEASRSFSNHHRVYCHLQTQCEVLEVYLKRKANLEELDCRNNNEHFKVIRNTTKALPLQFHDFFLIDLACSITEAYLDDHDTYNYDYDGLVNLSAEVAIYLFKNLTKTPEYQYYSLSVNMRDNPAGYYNFKDQTNILSYIESIIDGCDGIWLREDEDEEEEFDGE